MRILLIALLLVTGIAHGQQVTDPEGGAALDAKTFRERSSSERDAVILDVRTPAEVKEGIIPGATVMDFHAPDFASRIAALDKEKTYFVYCKVGGRSNRTVQQMKNAGFKHVHELKGGYLEWTKQKYPVKKP